MQAELEAYWRALISLVGRSVFDREHVDALIDSKSNKQLSAYNLCDGTLTQQQIAKKAGLDPGNFSKTVGRWITEGILFRIPKEDGRICLMHVFPLTKRASRKKREKEHA